MSIINRTKDASEQRTVFTVKNEATATGVTLTVGLVPWPCVLDEAQIAAWGLSGAPSYALSVNRFIVGTGFTTIVVGTGTSNVLSEFGTSGVGSAVGGSGMILAASGSTLLNLLANDLLMLTTGVANTAVKGVACAVVLRPTQDIKVHFGLL